MQYKLKPVGDLAVKVQFQGTVSPSLNHAIQLFCRKLEVAAIPGVIEWIPAFDSVTVNYDPKKIRFAALSHKLSNLSEMETELTDTSSRIIWVPVLYGGENGQDIDRVAKQNQLTTDEVVFIHQQPEYLVYMLGFLPGFPYLGGLDKRIATPRLEEPRKKTFAGAVGIAHEQTGIYSMESPGGWNIIGKTPLSLFNSEQKDPFLFHAGDRVKFYSVTEKEYEEIQVKAVNNNFRIRGQYDGETN